jgi:uncharacterized membrane protein YsdA (DUF1294 family)/cold shock CspA family protein
MGGVTRQEGSVTQWDDARGFGFIVPAAGGPRVFVHISAFARGPRPVADVQVTYATRRDERNRLVTSDVKYVVRSRSPETGSRGLRLSLTITGLFTTLLVGLVVVDRAPAWLLAPYVFFSASAVVMYREDKSAARRGAWRIPESNLHVVAVLGGWPGALVAQRLYRHKTTKEPFRTIFWVTVFANCAALVWFVCYLFLSRS